MKIKLYTLIAIAILMFSCGGDNENQDENNNDENQSLNLEDMNEISLVEYGLNMKLMLPEVASSTGASIEPTIQHDDGDYLWYLNIGNHFNMVIEDFGKEKNKVAQEKKRLEDLSKIFIIEYVIDEPGVIMYKRSLHDGLGGKPTYHCYGEKIIEGYTFVLKSAEEGNHKPVIEDMVTTIKSAKEVKQS